jgi:hypothetical protein
MTLAAAAATAASHRLIRDFVIPTEAQRSRGTCISLARSTSPSVAS